MRVTCQRIGNVEWRLIRFGWFSPVRLTINCSVETETNRERDVHVAPAGAPSRRRRSCWWCTTATAAFTGAAPTATASSSTRGRPASPPPTASAANAGAPAAQSPRSLCSSDYGEREKENRVDSRYYRSFMIFNDIDSTDFMFYGK